MAAPIAIPTNRSEQIRRLAASGLTAEDIATQTGWRLANVRAALKHATKDKPKTRAR